MCTAEQDVHKTEDVHSRTEDVHNSTEDVHSTTEDVNSITEDVHSRTLHSYRCIFPLLYCHKSVTFFPAQNGGLPPSHTVKTSHGMVKKHVAWPCLTEGNL